MSQQKGSEYFEKENSELTRHDSTITSKSNSRYPNENNLESQVENEKSFTEKWSTNRFWLLRGTYYVLRSVWMTVMVIGGFIVWLISFLFI